MNKNWFEAEALLKKYTSHNQDVEQEEDIISQKHSQLSHKVLNILKSLNFQIVASSPYSISIAATKETFEKAFQVDLDNQEIFEKTLPIPVELAEYVDGIYFQPPPTYF